MTAYLLAAAVAVVWLMLGWWAATVDAAHDEAADAARRTLKELP